MAKKDMLAPHSNVQYGAIAVVFLCCLAMIILPLWVHGRSKKLESVNYGSTVTFGSYYIMFNNAAYDAQQQKLVCDMYIKARKDGTSDTFPEIYSVASAENLDEFKVYELAPLNNEYGQKLTVLNVPQEALYVRIYLETTTPEHKHPDKTDAFGNIISGEVVPAETKYIEVRINLSELPKEQSASNAEFKPEMQTTEDSETDSDTLTEKPLSTEPSKSTVSVTTTTTSEEPTVTTTTTKKPTVTTTTTKKPITSTTTTTKAKTTTTKKTTTTTTTTAKPKTTTTTKKPITTTTTTTTIITGEVIPTGLKISCPLAANGIVTLNVGNTAQLTAEFTPDNVTNKGVVWSSRKPEVVTVDKNGKLTAVGKGTTTVSCETANGRFKVAIMVKVV